MQTLRRRVCDSHPEVKERVKWNAPSFYIDGDDRISVGRAKDGSVRVVLHRGVKPKPADDFRFDDPTGLIRWAAPDRGVILFTDPNEVDDQGEAFQSLCGAWLEATR